MTVVELLAAAEIEDGLAKHFAAKMVPGTIAEGSPTWELWKLHRQALERGAALREMANSQLSATTGCR